MRIPEGLWWWRNEPGGAAWLERLPQLAAECAEEWRLRLGAPFEPASVSLVVPATREDGDETVLKLNFPEPESEHEADALTHWDGRGAARLLTHDPKRRALLIERLRPGMQLWQVADEDEANRAAACVLRMLWRPAAAGAPYRTLAGEAERWLRELPARYERLGCPFERSLLDSACSTISELAPTQPELVVLHQDLHGGNILSAKREPWLAIDPKPLLGERAFDVASLLRDRRPALAVDPAPQRRIRRRLDLLSAELELDRERMRGWGIVHALVWGLDGDRGADEAMVAVAGWLVAD